MIVDDNEDAASMTGMLIEAWGYEVHIAHTGAESLRLAAERRPRVVLLDLGLPDQHGYDLAVELREQAGARRIYFVAITGWNQIADQHRSTAAGISHHLVKPANKDVLREILAAYQASEKEFETEAGQVPE
ncbi:MAG TPA: response regulator [Gemmatimonadales bacterium]|jgi:CheY-like chemotaxis protein